MPWKLSHDVSIAALDPPSKHTDIFVLVTEFFVLFALNIQQLIGKET